MILTVKQLKQSGETFFPQTVAEAVLVKNNGNIITLNNALEKKLESIITPAGSGLSSYIQDKSVIVTHSNTITANDSPTPIQIQYDNRGHIINTVPFGKTVVTVNKNTYTVLDGAVDKNINFGDDFNIDNNNIKLNWNNI